MKKRWKTCRNFLCAGMAVLMLAFVLAGCGSSDIKAELEKSSSEINVLPVNADVQVAAMMVNEAYRRQMIADLYAEAVLTYDINKGSIEDLDALLKKNAEAQQRAYDTSQAALYLSGNLLIESKKQGYSTYILPDKAAAEKKVGLEDALFSTAQAAYPYDLKSHYTEGQERAKEIMAQGNGEKVMQTLAKYPPEERLERLARILHTKDKKVVKDAWTQLYHDTHKEIMSEGANAWNKFKERASDVAYRTSAPVKTAGKVAKTIIALKLAPGSGGMAGVNVLVKTVDSVADAINAGYIVFTGNESEFWGSVVGYTEAADNVTSLFGGAPVSLKTDYENIGKLAKKAKLIGNEAAMARLIKLMDTMRHADNVSFTSTVIEDIRDTAKAKKGVKISFLNIDTRKNDDGTTTVKTTSVSADDPKMEEKLKEMGVDPEQAKELKENAQKAEEAAEKPITSEECVAAAETAEQAGFASKEAAEAAAKELDETTKEIKEEAKKELAKESAVRAKSDRPFQYRYNENASDDEQDKALDEGLDNRSDVDETEEDKEREAAESKSDDVKTNESSEENKNNESGTVSGKEDSGKDSGKEDTGKDSGEESGAVDADAPYAIAKVIGATYSTSTEVQGTSIWARYRVESAGDWISISCSTSHAGSFIANVTSYDQQTGIGVAEANGESHTFRISGEPGSMSLTFGE